MVSEVAPDKTSDRARRLAGQTTTTLQVRVSRSCVADVAGHCCSAIFSYAKCLIMKHICPRQRTLGSSLFLIDWAFTAESATQWWVAHYCMLMQGIAHHAPKGGPQCLFIIGS